MIPLPRVDRLTARRMRWLAPAVASVVLLPWVLYLGATLPSSYVTQDWDTAWVGFDVVTSAPGDHAGAALALCLEVPFAVFLFASAVRTVGPTTS